MDTEKSDKSHWFDAGGTGHQSGAPGGRSGAQDQLAQLGRQPGQPTSTDAGTGVRTGGGGDDPVEQWWDSPRGKWPFLVRPGAYGPEYDDPGPAQRADFPRSGHPASGGLGGYQAVRPWPDAGGGGAGCSQHVGYQLPDHGGRYRYVNPRHRPRAGLHVGLPDRHAPGDASR